MLGFKVAPFIILGAELRKSFASYYSTELLRFDSCLVIRVHLLSYILGKKSGFRFSNLANVLNVSASSSLTQPSRMAYKHCNALSNRSPLIEDSINRFINFSIYSKADLTKSFFRSVIIF